MSKMLSKLVVVGGLAVATGVLGAATSWVATVDSEKPALEEITLEPEAIEKPTVRIEPATGSTADDYLEPLLVNRERAFRGELEWLDHQQSLLDELKRHIDNRRAAVNKSLTKIRSLRQMVEEDVK